MRCHLSVGWSLAGALAAATLALGCAGSGSGADPTETLDAARVCKNGKGDCTPPVVAITSPSSGATVSGTFTVSGTASDAALKSVAVLVDGIAQNGISGLTSWSVAIDSRAFADGSHTVTAVATDTARNSATAAVQITISNGAAPSAVPANAPPSVAIGAPTSGATVAGTIAVSGTASDDVGVARVDVQVDGGTWTTASGTTSWSSSIDTTALANGPHTIAARATDTGGLQATTSIAVSVSNAIAVVPPPDAPPTIRMGAPASGATVAGTIAVSGTASDDVGVARVDVQVDGGTWRTASGTTSWSASVDTTALANGTHTIAARATDTAGQQTATSVSVCVSNSASTGSLAVSISSPSSGASVSGMVTVTGTSSGATRLMVHLDPLGWIDVAPSASWSYVFDSTALSNGAHAFVVSALDASGASTSAQVAITVSNANAAPAITIVAPAPGVTVSGSFDVTGFAYDITGVDQAMISIDGGAYQYTTGLGRFTYTLDTAKLPNGTHALAVQCADLLGATSTATTSFTVSNKEVTPPAIAIASPAANATVSGVITVTGTASDNDAVARVEVRESNRTYRPASGTTSWSYSLDTRGLANGTHTLNARAVDLTGNVAKASVVVTVANGTSNESLTTPEGVHITVNTASGFSAAEMYRILKENAYELTLLGPMLTVVVNDTESADNATSACSSVAGGVPSCTFRMGLNAGAGTSFASNPANLMAHEYGHVWAWYHVAYTNAGSYLPYLQARHLDVDPRLDSTYDMSRDELVADDYKILFGSADAQLTYGHRYVKYPSLDPALRNWFVSAW
jgi:Bacterial Ig domain